MCKHHENVEKFAAGAVKLWKSVEGLSDAQLDAFPVPGTWSIRQIVVHTLDSDLVAGDRMKRVAAMDVPLLMNYDEAAYARTLYHPGLSVRLACDLFEKHREFTAAVLRPLPTAAFERYGVHNLNGKRTLGELVATYIEHLEHHLRFIEKKRAMVGA